MDLDSITRMLNGVNATTPDGKINPLQITPLILDAFLPGYSTISRVLSQLIGFDICYIVSFAAMMIALSKAWGYLARTVPPLILNYITASVTIGYFDSLHTSAMEWKKDNQTIYVAKDLRARSGYDRNQYLDAIAASGGELFNFAKWAAKLEPEYDAKRKSNIFFHHNWPFIFEEAEGTYSWTTDIRIRTLGWSTEPIKALLRDIKQWSCEHQDDTTDIFMPIADDKGVVSWHTSASRPSRRLDTVVLDAKQKQSLIRDVNYYLSPASEEWYESRGILLRRGYLFHGPPGTEKSSLSFSLAGIFGLKVYVISMTDSFVDEENLMKLFGGLPKRCIILLEDIDEAGLVRRDLGNGGLTGVKSTKAKSAVNGKNDPDKDKGEDDDKDKDTTVSLFRRSISLSGLLNVIDGVASQEGRILILTSNAPDNLDPALLRPGRIDMKVHFTLATTEQLKEIFMRMYAPIQVPKRVKARDRKKMPARENTSPAPASKPSCNEDVIEQLSEVELLPFAEKFAKLIPDQKFSPAEIQNFLIARKKSPRIALEDVEAWRDEELKLKGEKDKEKEAEDKAAKANSVDAPKSSSSKVLAEETWSKTAHKLVQAFTQIMASAADLFTGPATLGLHRGFLARTEARKA